MSIELRGFKEFGRKLDDLSKKAEALNGEHQVPINDEFVQKHSNFSSMSELLEIGGFSSIEEADDEKFDQFISDNTDFDSWNDFLDNFAADYVRNQLGF